MQHFFSEEKTLRHSFLSLFEVGSQVQLLGEMESLKGTSADWLFGKFDANVKMSIRIQIVPSLSKAPKKARDKNLQDK